VLVYPQSQRFSAHRIRSLLAIVDITIQTKAMQGYLDAVGDRLKRPGDPLAFLGCPQIGAEANPAIQRQAYPAIDERQLDPAALPGPQPDAFSRVRQLAY